MSTVVVVTVVKVNDLLRLGPLCINQAVMTEKKASMMQDGGVLTQQYSISSGYLC